MRLIVGVHRLEFYTRRLMHRILDWDTLLVSRLSRSSMRVLEVVNHSV